VVGCTVAAVTVSKHRGLVQRVSGGGGGAWRRIASKLRTSQIMSHPCNLQSPPPHP
jgi:hypothetical protein